MNQFKRWLADNVILLIWLLFFVCSLIFLDGFSSLYNLKNYLKNCAPLLVVACGLTIPVLNGGTDFSTTSVLALVSTICAYIMVKTPLAGSVFGIVVAIVLGIVLGAAVGAINGIAVSGLKMPSFVATLSTKLIFSGIAVWFGNVYYDKVSLNGLPSGFIVIGGKGDYYWLPCVIALAVLLFVWWLLSKTMFGRRIYAVGVNPRTASISGIPVRKIIFFEMLLCGILAGISGLMYTAKNQAGIPTLGSDMFGDIVGAVMIGGTRPSGGFGGVRKTLYGVLFIVLLSTILNLLGVSYMLYDVIKGVFVLLAVGLELVMRGMEVKMATRAMKA